MNEETLVGLAQQGDRAALGELLLQHYDFLTRLLAPKIPARLQRVVSVDDVLQTTFAEAYRSIATFDYRGPGSVQAWLMKIGEHRLRDMVKSQMTKKRGGEHRRQEPAVPDSVVELLDFVSGDLTSPSRACSRQETLQALNLAMNSLPETYAAVIRLRFLEGRSWEETAAAIGKSSDAARSIAHRAKQELRQAFGRLSNYLSRD